MKNKILNSMVVVSVVLLLSISIVSAGFLDKILGRDPDLSPVDVDVSITNSPPSIASWTEPDSNSDETNFPGIQEWLPTSCSTTTIATDASNNEQGIDVILSDPNGDSDLDTTASVTISVSRGPISKTGIICQLDSASISGDNSDLTATFTCTVEMDFFDSEGLSSNDDGWIITAIATDDTGTAATNDGQTSQGTAAAPDPNYPFLSYGNLGAITAEDSDSPGQPNPTFKIKWDNLDVTSEDVEASNYLIVKNCGNKNIDSAVSFLRVNGGALKGNTVGNTDIIKANSFSVDQQSITHALDIDGSCNTATYSGAQNLLENGAIYVSIQDAVLSVGQSESENVYFCIEDILSNSDPSPITPDSYSSNPAFPQNWVIQYCEGVEGAC
jgi:hypothetical protein